MFVVPLQIKTPEKGSERAPGRQQVVGKQSMSLSVFKMPVGEIPSISQISTQSYNANFEVCVPCSACSGNWRVGSLGTVSGVLDVLLPSHLPSGEQGAERGK